MTPETFAIWKEKRVARRKREEERRLLTGECFLAFAVVGHVSCGVGAPGWLLLLRLTRRRLSARGVRPPVPPATCEQPL